MKILMTTDTIGGVWTYSVDLIRALRPHGVHVHLASMGAPLRDDQRAQIDSIENVTLHQSDYRLEWMRDPWKDVAAAGEWLLKIRADVAPDVVHLNNYAHGSLDWDLPVVAVAHSCVYSWMSAVRGVWDVEPWQTYHQVVKQGLAGVDTVIAPTRWMLAQLEHHYQTTTYRTVISNATHCPSRTHLATNQQTREPFIFAAGRIWDEAKNIAILAEIADRVRWPIRVAGSVHHPDGSGIKRFQNLELLGTLTAQQMRSHLSRAGIFAAPAKYEPFGLCPLEAAIHGCPLVLGDIPTFREIWGESATYLPTDDSTAWAQKFGDLIHSETLRHKLSEKSHQRAKSFSLSRMASEYYQNYNRLLSLYSQPVKNTRSDRSVPDLIASTSST